MLTEHDEREILKQWNESKTLQEKFYYFLGASDFCPHDKWDDLYFVAMFAHYRAIEEDKK